MKAKLILSITLLATALYSCDSHTYEELEEDTVVVERVTYTANIKSIIDSNCISCHSTNGIVPYTPLTTYEEVKNAVENAGLLDRIQLANGESGAMPQGGRMPQGRIDLILQWNEEGLLEN